MNISNSLTQQLKGLAIILVIIGHLSQTGFVNLAPVFIVAGGWGVAIFLFISGYGLSKSYLKTGITFQVILKRLRSVWFPYALVTLALLLMDHFIFKGSYTTLISLKLLLATDFSYSYDKTMWYISYIMMWYGIFYAVFSINILRKSHKVFLLFILSLILSLFIKSPVLDWNFYYFIFPFGVLIGCYTDELMAIDKPRFYGALAIVFSISIAVFSGSSDCFHDLSKTIYVALFCFSFLVCTLIIFYITQLESSFLKWIGAISYEIYLLEGVLLWRYKVPYFFSNAFISTAFYLFCLTLASYILSRLITAIDRRAFGSPHDKPPHLLKTE